MRLKKGGFDRLLSVKRKITHYRQNSQCYNLTTKTVSWVPLPAVSNRPHFEDPMALRAFLTRSLFKGMKVGPFLKKEKMAWTHAIRTAEPLDRHFCALHAF